MWDLMLFNNKLLLAVKLASKSLLAGKSFIYTQVHYIAVEGSHSHIDLKRNPQKKEIWTILKVLMLLYFLLHFVIDIRKSWGLLSVLSENKRLPNEWIKICYSVNSSINIYNICFSTNGSGEIFLQENSILWLCLYIRWRKWIRKCQDLFFIPVLNPLVTIEFTKDECQS